MRDPERSDQREERKLATILFADRVGYTEAAGGEDPERTRAVQSRLFEGLAAEVERAGGTVEKFVGDAILAAFGAPAALEHHAERALHAALAMQQRIEDLFGESLRLRIGVDTGEVVVGPARAGGSFVTGDAVNVAARLQQAAAPGEVLVGTRTATAVREAFEFGERRIVEAKGKAEGVACFPLVRTLSLVRPRGLRGIASSFVGREVELASLEAAFDRAVDGSATELVMIVGAPGVGKTRLARELWGRLAGRAPDSLLLTGRCLPYGSAIAYAPVADVLKQYFALENAEPEEVRRRLGVHQVLGLILGLEVPGLPPFAAQEALHEACIGFVSSLTRERPTVLLVEDLHWADDVLLDLLERLLGEVPGPFLLLGTARPELLTRRPAWARGRPGGSVVMLDPLAPAAVDELLAGSVGSLPEALRGLVVERAEGNPLFIEELLGALIDGGILERAEDGWTAREPPTGFAAPDSLQALLAARIDLLAPLDKDGLQAGSVIGRAFWDGAVQSLLDGRQPDFGVLVERDFVSRRPTSTLPPAQEYLIKHALVRDVAYAAIPKANRARLHAGFARWLEDATDGRDEHAGTLSHHYGEAVFSQFSDLAWGADAEALARLREKAFVWRLRAAELAVARGELGEAPALIRPALDLLAQLAPTPEHVQHELAFQMLLGLSYAATRGWAAPEAGAAYGRARELCEQAERAPQLFPVLFGLWGFYLVRGELEMARPIAERIHGLSVAADDPSLLLEAENVLGTTLYFQGELIEARAHLENAVAIYDPERHRRHALEYGQDPGVFALANLALVEAVLGFGNDAATRSDHAIELARGADHVYSLTFALALGAVLAQLQGNLEETAERAQEALELASAHGFPQFAAWATGLLGWVLGKRGQPHEGAKMLRTSIEATKATGARLTLPSYLGLLATTKATAGDPAGGLMVVDEAFADSEQRGEHLWESWLLGIRGKLQASLGDAKQAEASFGRARIVAGQQGAKLFQSQLEQDARPSAHA